MNLDIRRATVDDVETIVDLYVATKTASLPQLIEGYDRDRAFLTRRWQSYLTEGSRAQMALGDGFVLMAERDASPVGIAAYHHTRRHHSDAELQSIYVRQEAQGMGVGTALLREIARYLQDEGSKSLCVGYDPRNPYVRFYRKHGAVEINPSWSYWPDVSRIAASEAIGRRWIK